MKTLCEEESVNCIELRKYLEPIPVCVYMHVCGF